MHDYSPLLTDQYQLVMAYSYWKLGMAEQQAVFSLSFRKLPLQSSYILLAGLQNVIDFIENFQFREDDISYLRQLGGSERKLFPNEFLNYLTRLNVTCDLDVIPEGTVVFEKEPVLRISGPILLCQLLETPLLNFLNFSSLIATKASLVCLAAKSDAVVEFGLRRAQGPDGGLTASRSAYIGGCQSTSNALAGKLYGIPLQGTQAHSWIMAFPTELEAFQDFAQVMQSDTSLLVDTYDTIQGVHHAIQVGKALQKRGQHLNAIRLDSGNLLQLSRKARYLLDQAGLTETKIMASGDLDEHIIHNLKANDAPINLWGVGTKLVTSFDQPALNAIYKLTALKNKQGDWEYKMKISNDSNKATLPGILQVKRYFKGDIPIQDTIYDIELKEVNALKDADGHITLLQPIFREGKLIYKAPTLKAIREEALRQVKNYVEYAPKPYPVRIDARLETTITNLTRQLKNKNLIL